MVSQIYKQNMKTNKQELEKLNVCEVIGRLKKKHQSSSSQERAAAVAADGISEEGSATKTVSC